MGEVMRKSLCELILCYGWGAVPRRPADPHGAPATVALARVARRHHPGHSPTPGSVMRVQPVVVLPLLLTACALQAPRPVADPTPEIQALLEASARAWNAGDLEGFLITYARDSATTFLTSGGLTHGYDANRARDARFTAVCGSPRPVARPHPRARDCPLRVASWRCRHGRRSVHGSARTANGRVAHDSRSHVVKAAEEGTTVRGTLRSAARGSRTVTAGVRGTPRAPRESTWRWRATAPVPSARARR